MIPFPKPRATIVFALALIAVGSLGFVNSDEFGSKTGLPLPLLATLVCLWGAYLIVGSVRELKRRNRDR